MSAHSYHSPTPNPAIAVEINAATRKLHTELNKLIIDRLPLALPPDTQSPARYATGLSRFAAIFVAFEEEFIALKNRPSENEDSHKDVVQQWVATLLPLGMERTARLRRDLQHLQQVSSAHIDPTGIQEERAKLRTLVQDKPHILVAYAWIMYMAIFSGGRWIRQQLSSASNDFWNTNSDEKSLDTPGFTFLSFDAANDGEELKATFKRNLAQADEILSKEEREDIVNTGEDLFQHCIELIEKIDRDVWWTESTANWPWAFAVLGLGFVWLLWRMSTGQSILTV
ncbi:hypothetical protein AMS68_000476 [Peltaster fructicola]|uniref:Heme oxygenase-like protein n=1 Tax=Peltaster fructicola TaxID=286661 RepID=A0A6H0XJZ1_9PEZI|nr:hypothetical protein AMS68_000476 [Peltaster fructicola]